MWRKAFSKAPGYYGPENETGNEPCTVEDLGQLRRMLDWLHIKYCLIKPYFENADYPLVESRELLPSFEVDLYEYKELPGFSIVVLDRPLDAFRELFQYDALHSIFDWQDSQEVDKACLLENNVYSANQRTFQSRLPKRNHQDFLSEFEGDDICGMDHYARMLPFLLELERAHVISRDAAGYYSLSGIYASLPSNLDSELKQFGLNIGKFKPGDNLMYECNRLFVYQFLMELHGFPIVSERRTSASLFARRLHRLGEHFFVRVLGQSDRTITTLSSAVDQSGKRQTFPRVDKIALVQVSSNQKETIALLKDQGFFVDPKKRVVILKVVYQQHRYSPKNVREDRALSVLRQEVIHPETGRVLDHLNIIQDAQNMILRLNDIVRGEYRGSATYRREMVKDTDTHEKRLKFLYSWLSKHLHRIVDYSDEFYSKVVRVLDGYLLAPDNYEIFNELNSLYQDVWAKYSQIQQARKVRRLEDIRNRKYMGRTINYLEMLQLSTEILNDLKYEIVNYFDNLVSKVLVIGDDMINNGYLRRNYIEKKDEELSEYGQKIKKNYGRLVALIDEFRSIRKSRTSAPEVPPFGYY